MKIKNVALVVLFVSIIFSGCNKIEDALDVDIDANFKTDLNIDVPAEGRDANALIEFTKSATFNPSSNATILEYKDKLKSATVKKVTLSVTTMSVESINISDVVVTVSTPGFTAVTFNIPNQAITAGSSIELDYSQYVDLADFIMMLQEITVSVTGKSDVGSVTFTWQYELDGVITANPL